MGLFSKPELLEIELPFIYVKNAEDEEVYIISIEAYGNILEEYKYCYASFEVKVNDYDELSQLLIASDKKFVNVIIKVKNGKAKDFKIDLVDLAERLSDKRFEKISLLGWGLNDKSFEELNS